MPYIYASLPPKVVFYFHIFTYVVLTYCLFAHTTTTYYYCITLVLHTVYTTVYMDKSQIFPGVFFRVVRLELARVGTYYVL